MSGLPSGYTQLEYIQSTGTQHLDTLFNPYNHTRVVIDFRSTFSTANSPKGLLGSRNSSDIGMFAFLYAALRISMEQFREPDMQLGYFFGGITMGQMLSLPFLIAGGWVMAAAVRKKSGL